MSILGEQFSDFKLLPTQRGQRLRYELQLLFMNSYLKGKYHIQVSNLPYQLEILLKGPTKINFTSNQPILILFKFGENYPEDPPAMFLKSNRLNSIHQQQNILCYENWNSTTTFVDIVLFMVKKLAREGVENVLTNILPKKEYEMVKVSQQNYQNHRLQQDEKIKNFVSPFTCFKPIKPQIIESLSSSSHDDKFIDSIQNIPHYLKRDKKRRDAKPMSKNANLPKFLIRIFIKYVERFREDYGKKQYEKLQYQCRKMKDWKKTDKKQHAFGLKHLKRFFQDEEEGYPSPDLNRKVIKRIIERFLLQEICSNSQIPENHLKGYLTACRVYSLRCRNATLAGRIQSK